MNGEGGTTVTMGDSPKVLLEQEDCKNQQKKKPISVTFNNFW
jgi:hypothetical protein